jgi:hypothetical protein
MPDQKASELLIRIKTILESQGIDAAKKEMDDIISRQGENAAAQKMARELIEENGRATKELGETTGATAEELQKASRAAWAMRMAAQGSTEGLRGLSNAAAASGAMLGGFIARITMVGAAFMAGWKVGDFIRRQLIDPLIEARDGTERFRLQAAAAAAQYKALSAVSLAALIKDLKDTQLTTEKVIGSIERVYQQQRQYEAAKGNKEIARIMEVMPAGPDRDLAIEKAKVEQKRKEIASSDTEARKVIEYEYKKRAEADAGIEKLEKRARESRAARDVQIGSPYFDANAAKDLRQAADRDEEALTKARKERADLEETSRDRILPAQNTIDINAEESQKAESELRQAFRKRELAILDQKKSAWKDTITAEFGTSTDPKRLKEDSDILTALDLDSVTETDPQAKLMRQRLLLAQGRERLQGRLAAVAGDKAEGDVATARDRHDSSSLRTAEKTLQAVKSGNSETINRLLGISEALSTDLTGIQKRLQQLEARERATKGLE